MAREEVTERVSEYWNTSIVHLARDAKRARFKRMLADLGLDGAADCLLLT